MTSKEYIDLNQHDNELISISIDIENLKAVIKIKSFSWSEVNLKTVPDTLKYNGKCYHATFDKFIEIHLKLKYPDDYNKSIITCEIFPMQNESILWCYVIDDLFSLTCIKTTFDAFIENYEVKEVSK